MWRRPGDDLYRLDLHPETAAVDDGWEEDEAIELAQLEGGASSFVELPHLSSLMQEWRGLLMAMLADQGVTGGEVEVEALHHMGWKGQPLDSFLNESYNRQAPRAAICCGYGVPFVLEFLRTEDKSLRATDGGFVVKYDKSTKVLIIRPLSHLNVRQLPRPPDFPKMFSGSRVPDRLSWSVDVDVGSGQGWVSVRDRVLKDGSARVAVALLPLPSGNVTLALAGEGPGLQKVNPPVGNGDKDQWGACFARVSVSQEAKALLDGDEPGGSRIRDLSVWSQISELAPLRTGTGTTDLENFEGGADIRQRINDFIAAPPSADDPEYDGQDAVDLAQVSLNPNQTLS